MPAEGRENPLLKKGNSDAFFREKYLTKNIFGGVATRLVCDNLKTGVVSHPREGEVVLPADYEALGSHYQTAIMPAGIRKPKQKASVEGTVGKIATAIIARLRNETFYSFEDLKAAVAKKLYGFNHESFQKREGSRYDAYLDEKPFLHPLPSVPYEIEYSGIRVPPIRNGIPTKRRMIPTSFLHAIRRNVLSVRK